MIIDEVVWNVIKNKHCSFRMKYPISHSELSLRTSAETSTTSPDSATDDHVLSPILSTPQCARKRVSATFT
jgi:hypothetical protein